MFSTKKKKSRQRTKSNYLANCFRYRLPPIHALFHVHTHTHVHSFIQSMYVCIYIFHICHLRIDCIFICFALRVDRNLREMEVGGRGKLVKPLARRASLSTTPPLGRCGDADGEEGTV